MPLSSAVTPLENMIKAAFIDVLEAGKQDGADPYAIIAQLAADLAAAIDGYTTQAKVITDPGQIVQTAVITAGSAVAQVGTGVGASAAPGTGYLV